jgi:hypothetical protein
MKGAGVRVIKSSSLCGVMRFLRDFGDSCGEIQGYKGAESHKTGAREVSLLKMASVFFTFLLQGA